mgnify:CR=1 FL=1
MISDNIHGKSWGRGRTVKKIRMKAAGILAAVMCLFAFPAFADTGGGSETRTNGQTDVMAGVTVDYMGKLRFEAKEEKTMAPIPGASIELWIPGILGGNGAYVLFGITDEEGALELDIAYRKDQKNQWIDSEGKLTFGGSILYLPENRIQYQAYKADWLPYPKQDEVILTWEEIPQVVTVLLHKKGGSTGGGGSGGGETPESVPVTVIPETPQIPEVPQLPGGRIPKTGVEQYARYWGTAFLFFLAAAVLAGVILHREKKKKP